MQCWGSEAEDSGDPPRLWAPNALYPGTAFTRSVGDSGAPFPALPCTCWMLHYYGGPPNFQLCNCALANALHCQARDWPSQVSATHHGRKGRRIARCDSGMQAILKEALRSYCPCALSRRAA